MDFGEPGVRSAGAKTHSAGHSRSDFEAAFLQRVDVPTLGEGGGQLLP